MSRFVPPQPYAFHECTGADLSVYFTLEFSHSSKRAEHRMSRGSDRHLRSAFGTCLRLISSRETVMTGFSWFFRVPPENLKCRISERVPSVPPPHTHTFSQYNDSIIRRSMIFSAEEVKLNQEKENTSTRMPGSVWLGYSTRKILCI